MDLNNIPEALTLPLRLKILCLLIDRKRAFNELKTLTKATDGNISVQLSKLEQWGFVCSEKIPVGKKRSNTIYEITPFGVSQLEEYVECLQRVIQ